MQEVCVTAYLFDPQVLGYYNRRGINPEAFLREIKYIASDPDDKHFFNVKDESALKDIVDALGERIFSLEGMRPDLVVHPAGPSLLLPLPQARVQQQFISLDMELQLVVASAYLTVEPGVFLPVCVCVHLCSLYHAICVHRDQQE